MKNCEQPANISRENCEQPAHISREGTACPHRIFTANRKKGIRSIIRFYFPISSSVDYVMFISIMVTMVTMVIIDDN